MMERYFDEFVSNSADASGNQTLFASDGAPRTCRAAFRLTTGGRFAYSFLFSNTVDTTFADGSATRAGDLPAPWDILALSVFVCAGADTVVSDAPRKIPVTFGGAAQKAVQPGEIFASDPIPLRAAAGEYLVLEMTFAGRSLPVLEEALLPIFAGTDAGFVPDKHMPLPAMIGCRRPVRTRVAFLGDSITEGIGAPAGSDAFWVSRIARALGGDFSVWNLGVGYARAGDAAADGAWLAKAKSADLVSVCLGVNDLMQGRRAGDITRDLAAVAGALRRAGCRLGLFTVPPFGYTGERCEAWRQVNAFLRETLARDAEYVFDTGVLADAPGSPAPRFGGHPNAEGSALLAGEFLAFARARGILV